MSDRDVRIRTGLGLGVIGVTLLLLPLMLNVMRGGARGVGFDPRTQGSELIFAAPFPASATGEPLDGRLLVLVARGGEVEPRFRVGTGPAAQLVFGADVEGWRQGQPAELTDQASGFPLPSLAHIPPGHYQVQGVFVRYETFRRGDGRVLSLPAGGGEGGWAEQAGNRVSRPVEVYVDPRSSDVVRVDLARTVAAPPAPGPEPGVEWVRIRSERLSAFWGRDVFLEARVAAPPGAAGDAADAADAAPARYPLLVRLGATRRDASEAPLVVPGAIVVTVLGGSPYSPIWHAVDSPNLGPWGAALAEELLPEVERAFGGAGGTAGRFLFGVGVGGWQALAAQIARPDAYSGAWALCPGPVDFRDFGGIDLYADRNAYYYDRAWGVTPRPAMSGGAVGGAGGEEFRGPATLEQESRLEAALGSRSRSGGWWDGWTAALSPQGSDGYPTPLFHRDSGVIDAALVERWGEAHDLRRVLERDAERLAPALAGKMHVRTGAADLARAGSAVGRLGAFFGGAAGDRYAGTVREGGFGECADVAAGGPVARDALGRLLGEVRVGAQGGFTPLHSPP